MNENDKKMKEMKEVVSECNFDGMIGVDDSTEAPRSKK